MSEKTLKFNNIRLNKKELHKSKQPMNLMSVNVDQIVLSDKFKHNSEGFKYFIGSQEGEIVKLLCIILPQMSGYIKYFKNGNKNNSFLIKDDEMWEKYEQIWNVIKNKIGIKFHSQPVCDKKYIKAKVRESDGNFFFPKENMHYTCISSVTIDSVIRIDKKNPPQVYLEEHKHRVNKIQTPRFINTGLKLDLQSDSDSEPDSETESKSDAELMAKLKSESDSE